MRKTPSVAVPPVRTGRRVRPRPGLPAIASATIPAPWRPAVRAATPRAGPSGPLNYSLPAFNPWCRFWRTPWGRYTVRNLIPGPRRPWPAWPVPWCGPLRPANWKNDCGRWRTGAPGRLAREKSAVAWIHPSGGGPRLGLSGCIGHAANVVGGVRWTVGTLEDRGGGKVSP